MPSDWADFDSSDDVIEPFVDTGPDNDTMEAEGVDLGSAPSGPPAGPQPLAVPDMGPSTDDAPALPRDALAHVESILSQVEQALSRLDDGTYGQCLTCGSFIDDDVLATDPTAQACATCAPVDA